MSSVPTAVVHTEGEDIIVDVIHGATRSSGEDMTVVREPILQNSLHDVLVLRLRELIISGELRSGEKIPELRLCEQLGVSRTPMREALKVLAAEGIVQLLMNRGAIVAQTTVDEVQQLFPIMAALEELAGATACQCATRKDVVAVRRLHDAMLMHYRNGDESAYLQKNRAIHQAIFDIANNPPLTAMYRQLLTRIHSLRFVARKSPEHWAKAVEEHEAIITALEARDGVLLGQLLKRHTAGVSVDIALAAIDQSDAKQ